MQNCKVSGIYGVTGSNYSHCGQSCANWTIGISTKSGIMENAAERLLGQNLKQVRQLAEDLISSKMRTVSMPVGVEAINAVEAELAKVGLHLINLNLKDEPR